MLRPAGANPRIFSGSRWWTSSTGLKKEDKGYPVIPEDYRDHENHPRKIGAEINNLHQHHFCSDGVNILTMQILFAHFCVG